MRDAVSIVVLLLVVGVTAQPCVSVPCTNGATCLNLGNDFSCTCAAGYSGLLCQTGLNECFSSPCQNGGTCFDQVNSFHCSCPAGYSGTTCQTNINECGSLPCQNGGTCKDQINSFFCTCAAGYSGVLCGTNINECASLPCSNGGTCSDQVNAYSCACTAPYSGTQCQGSPCSSSPCQHGTCSSSDGVTYTCTCNAGWSGATCGSPTCSPNPCNSGSCAITGGGSLPLGLLCTCPGYIGTYCQTEIDECASAPCRNGGTCTDQVNRFFCTCAAGYSGLTCAVNINECASSPCRNGATCVDQLNAFSCTCASGFLGVQCEGPPCASSPCQQGTCSSSDGISYTCTCNAGWSGVNCNNPTCSSNPCVNGGACSIVGGGSMPLSLRCTCPGGYAGVYCQTDINECASTPCRNGGTCYNQANRFFCECPAGYSGLTCAVSINECASTPCRNGGTCSDQLNGYSCACASGFTGTQCQGPPCASSPCQQGLCSTDGLTYTCACNPGWTGINCNTASCALSPCQNGGTCAVTGGGSFPLAVSCTCMAGYTGSWCELLSTPFVHPISLSGGCMFTHSLSDTADAPSLLPAPDSGFTSSDTLTLTLRVSQRYYAYAANLSNADGTAACANSWALAADTLPCSNRLVLSLPWATFFGHCGLQLDDSNPTYMKFHGSILLSLYEALPLSPPLPPSSRLVYSEFPFSVQFTRSAIAAATIGEISTGSATAAFALVQQAVVATPNPAVNDAKGSATLRLITSVQWPYILTPPSTLPPASDISAATAISDNTACSDTATPGTGGSVGPACRQVWQTSITTNSSSRCVFTGSYVLSYGLSCHPTANNCPLTGGETVAFPAFLTTQNFCPVLVDTVQCAALMQSYSDVALSSPQTSFTQGNHVYFAVTLSSSQASVVQTTLTDLWVSVPATTSLYTSGSGTPSGSAITLNVQNYARPIVGGVYGTSVHPTQAYFDFYLTQDVFPVALHSSVTVTLQAKLSVIFAHTDSQSTTGPVNVVMRLPMKVQRDVGFVLPPFVSRALQLLSLPTPTAAAAHAWHPMTTVGSTVSTTTVSFSVTPAKQTYDFGSACSNAPSVISVAALIFAFVLAF